MRIKDPLNPTPEEREANRQALVKSRAIRTGQAGWNGNNAHSPNDLNTIGNLSNELRARIARNKAQAAADLRARREQFTGDCVWCFDEGDCDKCPRGREHARISSISAAEAEAARLRRFRLDLLHGAGIPPRRFGETFTTYPSPGIPAFREIVEFIEHWDGRRNLILKGPYGTGKTGLLIATLREVAERYTDTTHRMLYLTAPDLLERLRGGYDDHTFTDRLNKIRYVRLLAVDDLGAERTTEWALEQLFSVFNYRYEQDLPVFATTNHEMAELSIRLGPRVLGRVLENADVIEVAGQNLREKRS